VREREVVTYLWELFQLRSGFNQSTERLSQLSFFGQQFLVNAGFGANSDWLFKLELDQFQRSRSLFSQEQLAASANPKDMSKAASREFKRLISDIERKFHAQIDATLVLSIDSNISAYDPHYPKKHIGRTSSCPDSGHFNWHEVVRLFETFLLCESSLHRAKFLATQEALFLCSNKYLLLGDTKFVKFIRKLFAFFVPDQEPTSRFYPSNQISLAHSNLIACAACCLIDFCLSDLDVHTLPATSSLDLFHYALVEFLQSKQPFNLFSNSLLLCLFNSRVFLSLFFRLTISRYQDALLSGVLQYILVRRSTAGTKLSLSAFQRQFSRSNVRPPHHQRLGAQLLHPIPRSFILKL
jgi:hypothetical protein